mmetsp:Transcript_26785/g.52023  ORF Transcript_26785/g.52023 Transcript_26785/m.52023 type:complete len:87 (+) Transcript_26785:453-713(+)
MVSLAGCSAHSLGFPKQRARPSTRPASRARECDVCHFADQASASVRPKRYVAASCATVGYRRCNSCLRGRLCIRLIAGHRRRGGGG